VGGLQRFSRQNLREEGRGPFPSSISVRGENSLDGKKEEYKSGRRGGVVTFIVSGETRDLQREKGVKGPEGKESKIDDVQPI